MIEGEFEPGIYQVEFRAGDSVHTEYAVLQPGDDPVTIQGPMLSFSTPVPIEISKTSRKAHMSYASQLSREPRLTLGEGSGLFIFVRDLGRAPGPRKNPARGVSICDTSGKELVAVDVDGEWNVEEKWGGISLDVDPGSYLVRVQTDVLGSLEQTLVASRGWQTQHFMLQRSFQRDDQDRKERESRRRADLFNASVMMTRLERAANIIEGFRPAEEELRKIELARFGLAAQRPAMSRQQIDEILWEKYKDPLLGIYGGHLLLLERKPNLEELETVTNNLLRLVGDHPDVRALAVKLALLRYESLDDFAPFETPPMLRSSWQILVEASSYYPALIPAGSLAARVSSAIWAEGAWLTWRAQDITPTVEADEADLAALADTVSLLTQRVSDPNWLPMVESELSLNSLERGLLQYLVNTAYISQPPERMKKRFYGKGMPEASPESMLSNEALVQALGAPSASIGQAAKNLQAKLDLEP
jgi:hypothetical protein